MRVVVTLAAPRAQTWARSLRAAGHEPLVLPLLEICALPHTEPLERLWRSLPDYDAVVFVSTAAVVHFFAARPPDAHGAFAQPGAPQVWVTGPGTRHAACKHGVPPHCIVAPDAPPYDSEGLWRMVGATIRPGMRVLIVRGTHATQRAANGNADEPGQGREWLAQRIRDAAGQVDVAAAYCRCVPQWSANERECAQTALREGAVWLLCSAVSIDNLRTLLPDADWTGSSAIVTHPRLIGAARSLGFGTLRASAADIPSVCATLEPC